MFFSSKNTWIHTPTLLGGANEKKWVGLVKLILKHTQKTLWVLPRLVKLQCSAVQYWTITSRTGFDSAHRRRGFTHELRLRSLPFGGKKNCKGGKNLFSWWVFHRSIEEIAVQSWLTERHLHSEWITVGPWPLQCLLINPNLPGQDRRRSGC